MPMFSSRRVFHSRLALALSGLVAVAAFGGLAACSKSAQNKAEDVAENTMSDAGSMMSDAGSMITDAVTPDTPQDFVTKAAVDNMFEIETSKLALKSGTRADVKAFAKTMVDDHTQAGKDFKTALGKTSGVSAPAALDDEHKAKLDDLKTKAKGDDFDNAYIGLQKGAHDDAVSLFDNYAKNGTDPALQAFAAATLPTLQAHKDMVGKL